MKGTDTKRRTIYICKSQWGANEQYQQRMTGLELGFMNIFSHSVQNRLRQEDTGGGKIPTLHQIKFKNQW